MATPGAVHVLGVRHHGPGSARSVEAALTALRPDVVLIEGPPEADEVVPLAGAKGMKPPVALLVYRPDAPRAAAWYPFAEFSPEWRALRFGLKRGVPVRFVDLPAAHWLGQADAPEEPDTIEGDAESERKEAEGERKGEGESVKESLGLPLDAIRLRLDPLGALAEAAGFGDGERWWEHVVEHRRDGADVFTAVADAMAAVRDAAPPVTDPHEQRREAHMRQGIRAAQAEGHGSIAVVCGAWHAPALCPDAWPKASEDAALLKGLPKSKVAATWVPWTHGRLAAASGYGAGVDAPGWYSHLWTAPDHVAERWLSRVARLLRDEGLDASSASAIEAVRLAEALAALRGRHLAGLDELDEAILAILCHGDETPLRLIRRKLVVGERLGAVPPETPSVPLVQDLERLQKRLRLPPDPAETVKELDLREANDLERSRLLHRLSLLGVSWGRVESTGGKGTFKECWRLRWEPEFSVALIDASRFGPTVREAAAAKAVDQADALGRLPELATLLDRAILADLPAAVERIMARLEEQASLASDALQLLDALPPLANLLRYGNVRQTDVAMVARAVDGMVARAAIGLPNACASLDDDAAAAMFAAIVKAGGAIDLMQRPGHAEAWQAALSKVADDERAHGLVAGRATRALRDADALDDEATARRMGLAVSPAAEPARAAAWIEGFLRGGGELLVHDDGLFALLDAWIARVPPDAFTALLPLLRRTFGSFDGPLRRNLGEKAKRSDARAPRPAPATGPATTANFDADRAAAALPLVLAMLGLDGTTTDPAGATHP